MIDREVEKWKLKSDGFIRQMEHMDKAFKERTNTLQVKLSAQGKLMKETLKRNREIEEEMEKLRNSDMRHAVEWHKQTDEIARLRKMLKGRCTDEE